MCTSGVLASTGKMLMSISGLLVSFTTNMWISSTSVEDISYNTFICVVLFVWIFSYVISLCCLAGAVTMNLFVLFLLYKWKDIRTVRVLNFVV